MNKSHGLHQRTQCAVARWNFRRIRDVMPTATPGLVIVEDHCWLAPIAYTVTHQRTGCRIGKYHDNAEDAQDLASTLGLWTEDWPNFWTLSAEQMEKQPEVLEHVNRCIGEGGCNG